MSLPQSNLTYSLITSNSLGSSRSLVPPKTCPLGAVGVSSQNRSLGLPSSYGYNRVQTKPPVAPRPWRHEGWCGGWLKGLRLIGLLCGRVMGTAGDDAGTKTHYTDGYVMCAALRHGAVWCGLPGCGRPGWAADVPCLRSTTRPAPLCYRVRGLTCHHWLFSTATLYEEL